MPCNVNVRSFEAVVHLFRLRPALTTFPSVAFWPEIPRQMFRFLKVIRYNLNYMSGLLWGRLGLLKGLSTQGHVRITLEWVQFQGYSRGQGCVKVT